MVYFYFLNFFLKQDSKFNFMYDKKKRNFFFCRQVQPDSDLSILSKNDSTSSCNKDDEDEIPLDKRWKNWVKANSSNYTKLSTNQRIIIDVDELSTDQILSTIIGLVE